MSSTSKKFKTAAFITLALMATALAHCSVKSTECKKKSIPKRFEGNNESVFHALDIWRSSYKSLDFGAAMPNFRPPRILINALANATLGDYTMSQYSRVWGTPRLVKALAKLYSRLLDRSLDPMRNVLVTVGAMQALFTTFQTHTSPGDEWIIMEPAYDNYDPMIRAANGVPRHVALKPTSRGWFFDREELAAVFNERTKGIVLNTPHNPTGKVFTMQELEFVAGLARKWDTLVVSDEVYEFVIFEDNVHLRMATLPGMFQRTVTIGSGGKSFGATGLRIGWAIAEEMILENLGFIHHSVIGTPPTPIQEAFAVMLENEDVNFGTSKSFLHEFRKDAEVKRNYMIKILEDYGMTVTVPQGGYCLMANWTTIPKKVDLRNETGAMDVRFVKWMVKNVGVFGKPVSGYYTRHSNNTIQDSLRFNFVVTNETLRDAEKLFHRSKISA